MMVVVINVTRFLPSWPQQQQEQPQSQIDSRDRKTLNHFNDDKGTFP